MQNHRIFDDLLIQGSVQQIQPFTQDIQQQFFYHRVRYFNGGIGQRTAMIDDFFQIEGRRIIHDSPPR
jgi:hypothetical protein